MATAGGKHSPHLMISPLRKHDSCCAIINPCELSGGAGSVFFVQHESPRGKAGHLHAMRFHVSASVVCPCAECMTLWKASTSVDAAEQEGFAS